MRYAFLLLAAMTCWGMLIEAGATVIGSTHDLSVREESGIDGSVGNGNACIFCHEPHVADLRPRRPRWTNEEMSEPFPFFRDSALPTDAPAGTGTASPPLSVTTLCLSCHDGAVSSVDVLISAGKKASTTRAFPVSGFEEEGPGDLYARSIGGMDHPVDFVYPGAGEAVGPSGRFPPVTGTVVIGYGNETFPLDRDGRMQCTTCHDPHADTKGRIRFSADHDAGLGICGECHRGEQGTEIGGSSGTGNPDGEKVERAIAVDSAGKRVTRDHRQP